MRSDKNDVHEFYLMCDDVKAFIAEMETHSIVCDPVQDQGWGSGDAVNVARRRQARRLRTAARATKTHACDESGDQGRKPRHREIPRTAEKASEE